MTQHQKYDGRESAFSGLHPAFGPFFVKEEQEEPRIGEVKHTSTERWKIFVLDMPRLVLCSIGAEALREAQIAAGWHRETRADHGSQDHG